MAEAAAGPPDRVESATGWNMVRLTEARQVAAMMDRDPEDWPAAQDVVAGYRGLGPGAALDYLAHALPRLEAIAWAARVVEVARSTEPCPAGERQALDAALRWLGERSDAHRRAARAIAGRLRRPGAEYQLCQAIFYSGGSITEAGLPPIVPPEHAAARYVAGAIRAIAYADADPPAAFARALAMGELVAARGTEALPR